MVVVMILVCFFLGLISSNTMLKIVFFAVGIGLLIFRNKKKKKEKVGSEEYDILPSRIVPPYEMLTVARFLKSPPDKYVAFDLETTGLSPQTDRIIEIGAVYVENGQVERSFSQLVNPKTHIPYNASEVNHITDQMVQNCPVIETVLSEFLSFIEGATILVAHNAKFDADFLTAAATECGITLDVKFFDTLARARQAWPDLSNHKLGTVAAKIKYTIGQAHRAGDDARALPEIINAAMNQEKKMGQKRVEEEHERLAAIKITDTDRAMFSNRCPLEDVQPSTDYVSVQKGMEYYNQGEDLKRIGQLEDALILYNKARYYGYNSPALYENCAVTLRKLGRLADEVDILNEYLARNPNLKTEKFSARKQRAEELLQKSAGK